MTFTGYWWLALLLGLVVALVAVILLRVFLREVHRIEHGAGEVWAAGKQVASSTSATWLLAETSSCLDLLIDEAGRHASLLQPAHRSDGAI